MRSEPNIPLFLWVTAAIVAHALGGGSVTKVVEQIEETLDIGSFASQVRRQARGLNQPVEVSFYEDEAFLAPPPAVDELAPADNTTDQLEKSETDPLENNVANTQQKAPEKAVADRKKQEKTEEEKEKKEEKKVPDLGLEKNKPIIQPPVVPNRRVAVEQHVEDQNQKDNPDAEFAGEHANRVEEETQARITATDQNSKTPSPGQTFKGEDPEPGNANDDRLAQSDETAGEKNRVADPPPSDGNQAQKAQATQNQAQTTSAAAAAAAQKKPAQQRPPNQEAQLAQPAAELSEGMSETHQSSSGSFAIARAREAAAASQAQQARHAQSTIPGQFHKKTNDIFGYGSQGTTERGVNLNLNHASAHAVVGKDQMANLRRENGERRLSQHRGSWTSVGLKRWEGALANYVSSVKPGNQTALNTARVPFARYLNQIHQRLHQVFAHGFLGHLDQLPSAHPLNNQEMSTHLEIALSREDGRIVRMGITKSSGVTAFDVGALESVKKASPYGVPPGSIVSSDGNVYLHWEFHRKSAYACSTYFARPFIINVAPKPTEPRRPTPSPPQYEEGKKKPDERSGALPEKSKSALRNKSI